MKTIPQPLPLPSVTNKLNFLQHLFFLGTRRVRANQVYQDYISDRHHTHMNATQVSVGLC